MYLHKPLRFVFAAVLLTVVPVLQAAEVKEADLIGTWNSAGNLGVEEVTFASDHTFHASFQGAFPGDENGTWCIEDQQLIRKVTGGTSKDLAGESVVGKESHEKLVEIKGRTLQTETPGVYHYYRRGPFDPNYNLGPLRSSDDVAKAAADSDTLDLSFLPLSDFAALARFRELRSVTFTGKERRGATDEHLEALASLSLPRLEEIVLTDCPQVTDKGAAALARIAPLRELGLRGTSVGDDGCGLLGNKLALRGIKVENCPRITVKGLLALAQTESMEEMSFSLNKLTQDEVLKIIATSRRVNHMEINLVGDEDWKLDLLALRKAAEAKQIVLLKVRDHQASSL